MVDSCCSKEGQQLFVVWPEDGWPIDCQGRGVLQGYWKRESGKEGQSVFRIRIR